MNRPSSMPAALLPGTRVRFGGHQVPSSYPVAKLPTGRVQRSDSGVALVQFDRGGAPEWKALWQLQVVS